MSAGTGVSGAESWPVLYLPGTSMPSKEASGP